jgi:hypothetical protein
MKNSLRILALLACAGGAVPAMAQDSTSRNSNGGNGLPGDSLHHLTTGVSQKASYVVDLRPFTTSWGTTFGIAPIIKGSKPTQANPPVSEFFSTLISAQSISQTFLTGVNSPAASYASWTATPGAGVNPTENTAPGSVAPLASGTTFAVGFSEFSTETGLVSSDGTGNRSVNNIIAGQVWFDPAQPTRLYVTRTVAANNLPRFDAALTRVQNGDRSQFGYGAVDASGEVVFRADDFGATSTVDKLLGNNYFRVNFNARNASVLNLIDQTPTSEAAGVTDWLVVNRTGTNANHNCPSTVPADLAALGQNRIIGSSFAADYIYEPTPGTTATTTAHRTVSQNARGGVNFSAVNLFGGVGTAGMLMKDATAGDRDVQSFQLWAVDGTGNVVPSKSFNFRMPRPITDACTGFALPEGVDANNNPIPNYFDHYHSQTFSRGGPQVAIGKDAQGRGLGAAMVVSSILQQNDNPFNAIAVARFNPATPGTVEWTLAAWVDPFNLGTPAGGKEILDGPGGNAVGRLSTLSEITGAPFGPSMSAPAFDSAGNVWFLAAAELFGSNGNPSNYDICLIRAVYNPTTFCYELERVLDVGQPFMGENSGLRYQVRFLSISDGDSVDSATLWAANTTQRAWNNSDPAQFAPADPQTLGGLVLQAQIVYDAGDRNGGSTPDGNFDVITGSAPQFPNSRDENYNVLLYIGNVTTAGCAADFNGDNQVDFFDYLDFAAAFDAEDESADFNGDNQVDFFDYLDFVAAFDSCQ